MADPRIDANLDVFLRFDFNQKNSSQNLAIANYTNGNPSLTYLYKHDKKALKNYKTSCSLKKVVQFVTDHQDVWLKNSGEQRSRLEYQLAGLEKKIREYNKNREEKKTIVYDNPGIRKLTFKIFISNAFESNLQKYIISETLNSRSCHLFDRRSTICGMHEKYQKLWEKKLPLQVKCMSKTCRHIHEIQIKISELFESVIFQDQKYKRHQKNALLISQDQPLEDLTIVLEATNGNSKLLKEKLNALHPSSDT
jgi:hypothetical protein